MERLIYNRLLSFKYRKNQHPNLFQQVKKEIREVVQSWSIRNLTNFRRHDQYYSFQPANSRKFPPSDTLATCRGS